MSKNRQKVTYRLNSGNITRLTEEEIKAILRAADELITTGGRSMLTKILKGSKDKKLLDHGLESCPSYGYYRNLTLQEISNRVDWAIKEDYIRIEYFDRLPMLVFSEKGWEIERETYANELLLKLSKLLKSEDYSYIQELKDRNRGMILLLIEKIKDTGNPGFTPLLKAWQEIDYKKVKTAIQDVIEYLMSKSNT